MIQSRTRIAFFKLLTTIIIPLFIRQDISLKTCDCLKWKYKGNGYLEAGKIDLAIDAYDNALATSVVEQEGIILLMRATAYLQRAANHRTELKTIVNDLATMVPNTGVYQTLYQLSVDDEPCWANAIFRKVLSDTSIHETQFRQTQYKHGLYQYSLLQAAQDSLRATQLLENYSSSWVRAGEILSELWKLQQSIQYYQRSIELDVSLTDTIVPIIERLHQRQELLSNARAYGWSEDTLRLALDVAR
jgi:tetratricopeptide (TPR) repeat protein